MSARVRRVLVKSLCTQPSSLAIGAITTVAAGCAAAWVEQLTELYVACALLTVIATARVTAALGLSPDSRSTSTNMLELIYEVGAFSYAFVLGLMGAMTIWLGASAEVMVLMVANALCYGVGVAARNAGRPSIAIGQLTLVCIPIIFACLSTGSVAFIALAITIMLLITAMM
ncbi:MAG: hypothetical protein AAGE86_03295 [Pseudomonadota bacterium]